MFETLKLTTFGMDYKTCNNNKSNVHVKGFRPTYFKRMLELAHIDEKIRTDGVTVIYQPLSWRYGEDDWRACEQERKMRKIDTVILDSGIAEFLIADVQDFMKSGKW
jgi:hypothetical protein